MFPPSIQQLINHFSFLPGIGPKTAERLVFYLLKQDKSVLNSFSNTLLHIKDNIKNCSICGQVTENSPATSVGMKVRNLCSICSNQNRNHSVICVVAESADILALEKSSQFNGVYHILNGLISPTEGVTPDKLNIAQLENRIKKDNIQEIILALNPTIEGETTNLYLTKILKKYNLKITKLARGLPQGADLEYADEITLANAFRGRTIL